MDAWRGLLGRLAAAAPWRLLPESVEFTFEGGSLNGSVAIVLGRAEQVYGVALYPTRDDLRWFQQVSTRPSLLRRVRCVTVQFESASELGAAERAACAELGLPGLFPRVFTLKEGAMRPAGSAEQAAIRRAVEAVLALCEPDLAAIAAGAPRETRVGDTVARVGPQRRAAAPLAEAGALLLTTMSPHPSQPALPTLVLKFHKANAERIALELGDVADLALTSGPDALDVHAAFREGEPRSVTRLPPGDVAARVWRHFDTDRAWLVVAAGGTRSTLRERDLIRVAQVGLRKSGAPPDGTT